MCVKLSVVTSEPIGRSAQNSVPIYAVVNYNAVMFSFFVISNFNLADARNFEVRNGCLSYAFGKPFVQGKTVTSLEHDRDLSKLPLTLSKNVQRSLVVPFLGFGENKLWSDGLSTGID
jgi:hypothetical protein